MSSQKNEMPALQLTLCSLIKSFFETLTADQLVLLTTGTPDETTAALTMDLISNIIQNVSAASLTYFRTINTEVTQELVTSSLGNAVTDSFKAALDVTARGQSLSAEALRDMISEEVLVSVQCSMSDAPKEHVPAPKRLKKMLTLASRMIKAIKKRVCTPCKKTEDVESDKPSTSSLFPQSEQTEETPEDVSEENPSDVSEENSLDVSEENPSDVSEENSSDVSEENSLDVAEETPEDVSEENSSDVSEENSLDVAEENPSDVSEENSLDVAEENPLDVAEENPLDVTEANPLDVAEEIPLDVAEEIPLDVAEDGPEGSVTSMEVNFVPTTKEEVPSLEEMRKNTVSLVVERLVSLIYLKNKVSNYFAEPAILIERLMARTWAAVEDVDFDPSPKIVADLEAAIFKDLVKKYGCGILVLSVMKAGSPALEQLVVDAIRARLTLPQKKKKCSRVRRFFSSVGRAIAGFCKGGSEAAD